MTIILTHYFLKSLGPLRIISKCKLIHDPRGHDQPYCIGALSTFLISMKQCINYMDLQSLRWMSMQQDITAQKSKEEYS